MTKKFRAWNTDEKRWESPTNVMIELSGDVVHVHHEDGGRRMLNCGHLVVEEGVMVTGCSVDEVFEGDIVKVDVESALGTVETVLGVVDVSRRGIPVIDFPHYGASIAIPDLQDIELVGNVHETVGQEDGDLLAFLERGPS